MGGIEIGATSQVDLGGSQRPIQESYHHFISGTHLTCTKTICNRSASCQLFTLLPLALDAEDLKPRPIELFPVDFISTRVVLCNPGKSALR